jgi:predicted patatin/cPLA2 family phospholipase
VKISIRILLYCDLMQMASAFLMKKSWSLVLQNVIAIRAIKRRVWVPLIRKKMMQKQVHPVVSVILGRAESNSRPAHRDDSCKVGLAIEGGGMRGVVSAGMVTAIEYSGLTKVFDAVYGSSAGSMNGAYFIAGQARYGATVYFENINNNRFIDTSFATLKLLAANKPIMNLHFLLDKVMTEEKVLNWQAVINSPIRLNVLSSCLDLRRTVIFNNFQSREELFRAFHASASMPLVAGLPVVIDGSRYWDGSFYESIPVKAAVKDGCTHVLVLRTRPDGMLRGKPSLTEKYIMARRIDKLQKGLGDDFLRRSEQYASVIRQIEEAESEPENAPFIYSIKLPKGASMIKQTETRKSELIRAAREGLKTALTVFFDKERFGSVTEALFPFSDKES